MIAVIDAFVSERPPRDPDAMRAVLSTALSVPHSWSELVAGTWVLHAPTYVADLYAIPGYRTARVLLTIERFVRWMHGRGALDDWQRDRLLHAIDEARYCHFVRRVQPPARGLERPPYRRELDGLARRFAKSLAHPIERQLAARAVQVLDAHLALQLGGGAHAPFGALDVGAFVDEILQRTTADTIEADCTLFTIAAAFYRWMGSEGLLDPERSAAQAAKLAAAALGTQRALARVS